MGKILSTILADLRLDLKDSGTLWSDGELTRCVERAVADLTRFKPLEQLYESTFKQDVSSESWTSAGAHGTYISLANKPIKYQSETVTNAAGTTTYTRDTDYTIDYTNGKITTVSTGSMAISTAYKISYDKSSYDIDVSSLTDIVRVVRLELPVGAAPKEYVSFEFAGSILRIGTDNTGRQISLSDGQHFAIHYEKSHTMPGASAGTYESFLDFPVELAAGAYAMLIKAAQMEHQAIVDLASMRTALSSCTAVFASTETALGRIHTYLANNSNNDAAYWLSQVNGARSAIDTAVGAANEAADAIVTLLTSAYAITGDGTEISSAHTQLTSGIAKINLVNIGANVPENYRAAAGQYAQLAQLYESQRKDYLSGANTRANQANVYIQEAEQRISNLMGYIQQSLAYAKIAEGYATEANARLAELNQYITQALRYEEAAGSCTIIAEKFRQEAIARRDEAWAIFRDPSQYSGKPAYTSARQVAG